ncbi:DUF3558 family protein [Corynebacterium sp. MSK218]|uniref:DUF3558 family protein n=1 Tax=Corynebacterium sp. MSK218 TaxID=3050218 RepID=UPI003306B21E
MKRIGGLVLVAACMGVLSSCASLQGLGVRSHGVGTGGSHDFSDVKDGGDSAVSGVADVTATGERGNETASGVGQSGGGVLPPLGDFDRSASGFKVFDPCTEIPSEVFAELGVEMTSAPLRESGYRSCQFSASSNNGGSRAFLVLESEDYSLEQIQELYPYKYSGLEGIPGEIYTVEDTFIRGVTCSSYVQTVRGLISVSWTESTAAVSMRDKCQSSADFLSRLI